MESVRYLTEKYDIVLGMFRAFTVAFPSNKSIFPKIEEWAHGAFGVQDLLVFTVLVGDKTGLSK